MNAVESAAQPANMHILATETGRFYQRYLLKKALSVFKWTLPDWWDENYFLYVLYCFGFVGIFDTKRFGVIPNQCGLKGLNVFYRPTSIIIANPLLTEKEKRIDADCVVMQLQPDYMGILDLCAHYAEKMSLASSAISQNLWSTKIATVFFAENDAQQQSIKKAFDKMSAGDPMVVVNKKLRDENGNLAYEVFNRDVKQSYVIDDLLTDLRKIEAEFDTRIGVPNANTDKRERLITDEVNANNVETHILADMWMDSIQSAIKKVRDMFGLEIKCEWRYGDGADSKSLPVGSVSV
jgi:hypothetical protein